ncbi:hypothetical protein DXG03_009521 [Asterophora parasitica]|uniref:Uncharacterized protein n=1 Tax=Asterophora parasitica TaxID=117018 RepID=A0A9P7KDI2_9AGAR|nr:hypothetical protein DXG03_009521 [Asterophora parasitica]
MGVVDLEWHAIRNSRQLTWIDSIKITHVFESDMKCFLKIRLVHRTSTHVPFKMLLNLTMLLILVRCIRYLPGLMPVQVLGAFIKLLATNHLCSAMTGTNTVHGLLYDPDFATATFVFVAFYATAMVSYACMLLSL